MCGKQQVTTSLYVAMFYRLRLGMHGCLEKGRGRVKDQAVIGKLCKTGAWLRGSKQYVVHTPIEQLNTCILHFVFCCHQASDKLLTGLAIQESFKLRAYQKETQIPTPKPAPEKPKKPRRSTLSSYPREKL